MIRTSLGSTNPILQEEEAHNILFLYKKWFLVSQPQIWDGEWKTDAPCMNWMQYYARAEPR